MSWRNSQGLCLEDTLLNCIVVFQAHPDKKLVNMGDWKKDAHVLNWNLVIDAWLGQFEHN